MKKLTWLRCPEVKQGYRHSWQSYVLYVDPEGAPDTRNNIMEKLQLKGISTRPGTHAVHMLGYYKQRYSLNDDMFPNARDCNDNSMAIPLHNKMTLDDVKYVIDALCSLEQ